MTKKKSKSGKEKKTEKPPLKNSNHAKPSWTEIHPFPPSSGLSSLCARIGGIVFPIIIGFFDGRGHPEIPMLVFGVVSLVSGTLTAFLPETLNKVLPETLEQADEFGRPKCCGGRGTGRNEGAPLLGGGLAGNLLRPGEGRSLLGDDEDDDDELFSTNTLT